MKGSRSPTTPTAGFTLVEMLAAAAVILILAALVTPFVSKGMEKARTATCLANLRALGQAWSSFAVDHDGRLPSIGWRNASNNAANPGIRDYVGLPLVVGTANWNRNTAFTCPVLQSNPATATQEVFHRTYSVNQLATDVYGAETPPVGLKRRMVAIRMPSQFAVAMDGLLDPARPLSERYSLMVRNFGGTNQRQIQRPHQNFTNVLFADGHVAPVSEEVITDTSPTSVFWRDP